MYLAIKHTCWFRLDIPKDLEEGVQNILKNGGGTIEVLMFLEDNSDDPNATFPYTIIPETEEEMDVVENNFEPTLELWANDWDNEGRPIWDNSEEVEAAYNG